MRKIKALIFIASIVLAPKAFAVFTCSLTTSCSGSDVTVMKLYTATNTHAELPWQSNYSKLICCTGIASLGNSCSGTYAEIVNLSDTTNAHVEEATLSNYSTSSCVSNIVTPTIAYQEDNCTGYDTGIISMSATGTNAHVADYPEYTHKVCGTIPTAISFELVISDNGIGFGELTTSNARFATGDGLGTTTQTEAHTIEVATNAGSGYSLFITGNTLTSVPYPSRDIDAIGATSTASAPSTEQYGMRATATGGSGIVDAPYAAAGFALDTASFPDLVAHSTGSSTSTTYSMRYIANISVLTASSDYRSDLYYTAAANF